MMDNNLLLSLKIVAERLLYDPKTKKEFALGNLWKYMKDDEVIWINFFTRFVWIMCRIGAYELSKTIEDLNADYDNKILCVAIGVMEEGYDEFTMNYFSVYPTYINKNMTIYKALKYNKPGLLKCFGLCVKGWMNKFDQAKKKKDIYNFLRLFKTK